MRGFVITSVALVSLTGIGRSQSPVPLTLAHAQKIALQNNPQVAISRYSADAAAQVTKQVGSARQPTVFGSVTGTGAGSTSGAPGKIKPQDDDRPPQTHKVAITAAIMGLIDRVIGDLLGVAYCAD